MNPWQSTSLLQFYPMSKAYLNNFTTAYDNRAYALFSRSHLVRLKDGVDPAKQNGIVYSLHLWGWKTNAR